MYYAFAGFNALWTEDTYMATSLVLSGAEAAVALREVGMYGLRFLNQYSTMRPGHLGGFRNPRMTADIPNGIRVDGSKPNYRANPAHDDRSTLYNPKKTPEPTDSIDIYKNAIQDSKGNYFGVNSKSEIYQFANSADGTYHYSGTISKQDLYRKSPEGNKIRKQLGLKP